MQTADQDSIVTNQEDSLDVLASIMFDTPVEQPVVSLFKGHSLHPIAEMIPAEHVSFPSEFAALVLGICAMLIIYLQRNSDGLFSSVFKGSFDMNLALQESRADNSQRSRNVLLLQVISALSISLLISGAVYTFSDLPIIFHKFYFQVLGVLAGLVLLKKGVQWLLATFFQLNSALKSYHFNTNILMSVSGLMVLPLCLLLFFSPQISSPVLIYMSMAVVGFFYLKTIHRGFQIALSTKSISPLHLFYYLCALEILPVFVLIRLALDM